MRFLDSVTRPAFGWFDLVFIMIAFTLARDLLPSALQALCFFAIGAVVGAEQAWLRPRIGRRRKEARCHR